MPFLRVLVLALVGSLGLFPACGMLRDAESPRLALFACQVAAIEPLTGDVIDAEALVRDLYTGRASLTAVLQNLKATVDEANELNARLMACEGAVQAPAPAPGNKLIRVNPYETATSEDADAGAL